ncbi:methyltransferase [Sphingomonas sp. DBB INV C78]|uniref:class I SAM-dependent methyltransferase n=1 Tax=Sphingomonas sp. DBB INV C78 TaxID=3349434 RepID=UPI0036D2943C
MKPYLTTFAAGLMLLGAPAFADVSPTILKAPGRSEAALAADAGRKPIQVLDFFGVAPGMKVLDLMAGGGYYSELLGQAVGPKGSVLAFVNATPEDGDTAKLDAAWQKLMSRNPNVRLEKGNIAKPDYKPASFDFALLHLEYHDFYWESEKYHYPHMDPNEALKRLYAAMKPGGVVGVVDHVADAGGDTRAVVDKLHRIDPAVVKADFQRAGFVLDAESPVLMTGQDDHSKLVFDPAVRGKTDRFVFRFRKPK